MYMHRCALVDISLFSCALTPIILTSFELLSCTHRAISDIIPRSSDVTIRSSDNILMHLDVGIRFWKFMISALDVIIKSWGVLIMTP